MYNIESSKPKKREKRYEGLKPKLIHLSPKTFNLLDACSKIKGLNLKNYIEELCEKQALYEAEEFIKLKSNINKENKK